jgi:hypothetical protein
VPGCAGTGTIDQDYCTVAAPGRLVLMGNDNVPASSFPLGRCQGDCDVDADCKVRVVLYILYTDFKPVSFPNH